MLPPTMIRGSLRTMRPVDLLDWIDRRELKGELAVERGNLSRRFQLAYGCIAGASSTHPAEFLGQLLLNENLLSEEQLRAAFVRQQLNGLSLGRTVMIDPGLAEEDLQRTLDVKIRESICDLLSWTDGDFVFDPDAPGPKTIELPVAVPLRDAMIQGEQRAAQWQEIRKIIPDDDAKYFLAQGVSPSTDLLAAIARGLTLRELMLDHHSLPFPIVREVAELVKQKLVSPDRRAAARERGEQDLAPAELISAAQGRARGGDRDGALALARRAVERAPSDEAIKAGYAAIERSLFAELSRRLLTRYRVPKLLKSAQELASVEMTAEERYFVGRIDGRWDLVSLMRVSPLREVEALITLQKLATRGLISLE
jgi:hypothetical protein